MKIPSLDTAIKIFNDAGIRNPGRWQPHALNTALAAKNIASNTDSMDAQAAYILGLLHDIGRREGITKLRHTIDGYNYMTDLGYDDVARINLTHSFILKNTDTALSKCDCTKEEMLFIRDYINRTDYDDYDLLIQLCDCLSLPEGFCIVEKRLVDVIIRYGTNSYTQDKTKKVIEIKKYFDKKCGCPIYDLLPGIADITINTDLA